MRARLVVAFGLVIGLLVVCGPLFAHHGSQGFDRMKRVTLKGTVKQLTWTNPHAQLFIDVKDSQGNVDTWIMELASPGSLVQRGSGWTKNVVKPGDEITVSFAPGKNGRLIGFCTDVILRSGQKLQGGQGCVGQPGNE